MTESDIIAKVEQQYPTLHQLLICVLMSQYYPDRLTWAVREFASDCGAEERREAIRELDQARDFLASEHRNLESFLNYVLDAPKAAAQLLDDLARLLGGIAHGAPQA